jgi:microcystin-dependent protein
MPLWRWSQTASSNATADPTVGYAEGQSPSSLNDSARAAMAAVAMYRDDISGALVTSGTSTAYTVASNSSYDSLAHLANQMIAFSPHVTNGAGPVTLSVDSQTPKPLRSSPGVELLAGTLIQGTPYVATLNNTDGAFYLHGFYGNAYNIPLAGLLPFVATSVPNSSFAFPYGQAISRTTYSTLFAQLSTNFGVGDGSTTFNIPDLRGRVPAGFDAMGGTSANRLTAASGFSGLFSAAGAETKTLVTGNLPAYTPTGSIVTTVTTDGAISQGFQAGGATQAAVKNGVGNVSNNDGTVVTASAVSTFTGTAQGGTSTAFATVMPAMQVNYILRVI